MHHHEHAIHTEGHMIHWAGSYDLMMKVLTLGREKKFRRGILATAKLKAGDRVLDVGCGTGTLALVAAEIVGCRVFGIDPAPEMIARARGKAAKRGADVAFENAAIEALPYADASMDVVVNSLMFHHLTPGLKSAGLAEIARVLRPGGRLLIADFGSDASIERLVGEVRAAGFGAIETGHLRPRLLRYVTATTEAGDAG